MFHRVCCVSNHRFDMLHAGQLTTVTTMTTLIQYNLLISAHDTYHSSTNLPLLLQSAATEKRHQCVQAPLALEAGRNNGKECSMESIDQDQVEEDEEDHVEEEVATSSGRDHVGAAPQGPRGGSLAGGCLKSCCKIKPHSVITMTLTCYKLHTVCAVAPSVIGLMRVQTCRADVPVLLLKCCEGRVGKGSLGSSIETYFD